MRLANIHTRNGRITFLALISTLSIIFGLSKEPSETKESLRMTMESSIKQRMNIPDATEDLVYRKGMRILGLERPVILRLVRLWDKERILKAKKMWNGVSIREDLPPEIIRKSKTTGESVTLAEDRGKRSFPGHGP